MATARDLKGTNEHVVAVCGDAAFTCGITLEALNNVVASTKRLIVVLNDNEWSIARNVGAMAKYLNRLSTSTTYNRIHHDLEKFFMGLPHGHEMNQLWVKWKRETKDFFVNSSLFEKFGLRYIGPIDGHNLEELQKNLEFAKQCDVPVLIHVITKKGKGLDAALNSPEKFHGVGAFDPVTGESAKPKAGTPPAYQDVFGQALVRFAKADPRIVGITAAMPSGTGLSQLAAELPRQFFDVGIAEEHAVALRRRHGDEGPAPGVRDLLDLPAARLRPDHPRRRAPEPARDLLPGPGRPLAQRRPDPPRALRHRLPALRAEHHASCSPRTRTSWSTCSTRASSWERRRSSATRAARARASQIKERPRPAGDRPRRGPPRGLQHHDLGARPDGAATRSGSPSASRPRSTSRSAS